MRPSVRDAFPSWSATFEGDAVPWPYLDAKSLVTLGTGQLCDPFPAMNGIRFIRPDGSTPTSSEVSAMWLRTKGSRGKLVPFKGSMVPVEKVGGGNEYWQYLNTLRATPESMASDLVNRAHAFEADLRITFPDYDAWPACAQLAILGFCWAAGSHAFGHFPKFTAALRAQDWTTAARECHLDETGNPGLKPRNVAQRTLFEKAAAGGDPDAL